MKLTNNFCYLQLKATRSMFYNTVYDLICIWIDINP